MQCDVTRSIIYISNKVEYFTTVTKFYSSIGSPKMSGNFVRRKPSASVLFACITGHFWATYGYVVNLSSFQCNQENTLQNFLSSAL